MTLKYACLTINPTDWEAYRILRKKVKSNITAAATKAKQLAIDHGFPTCPLTSQEPPFCPPIENDVSPKFTFERMEHIVHNQVFRYLTSNSEISIRQRDNKQLYSSEKNRSPFTSYLLSVVDENEVTGVLIADHKRLFITSIHCFHSNDLYCTKNVCVRLAMLRNVASI